MNEFSIDHNGINGQWRVWWLDPKGYTVERLFRSELEAQMWIDFTLSLE